MAGTWDHPDFTDPRFKVEHVTCAARCSVDGCDRHADWDVDYSMRRDGWTYDYGHGYCDEHLPARAREQQGRTIDTVLGPIKVNPECLGQAVCTNGSRCWEAGECLRPYQCKRCLRSTARPERLCASCAIEEN